MERELVVPGQLAKSDAEGVDGAFEAFEEVDGHQRLDAPLLAGEGDVAGDAFEVVAVRLLVFRETAWEDVVTGRVTGQCQLAELFVNAIEGRNVRTFGERRAE